MSEDHTVSFSLEVNVDEALTDIRKVQTVLYRTLGLMRQFGVGPNIDAAITKFQRAIAITNQLRLTVLALYHASGPIGWALALIGAFQFAATTSDFMHDEMKGA